MAFMFVKQIQACQTPKHISLILWRKNLTHWKAITVAPNLLSFVSFSTNVVSQQKSRVLVYFGFFFYLNGFKYKSRTPSISNQFKFVQTVILTCVCPAVCVFLAAGRPSWPGCHCVPCQSTVDGEGQEEGTECRRLRGGGPNQTGEMNLCWNEIKRKSHNIR